MVLAATNITGEATDSPMLSISVHESAQFIHSLVIGDNEAAIITSSMAVAAQGFEYVTATDFVGFTKVTFLLVQNENLIIISKN